MRYLLPYLTDRGDEILIRIDYFDDRSLVPIPNDRRLEIGGWDINNDPRNFCEGLVLERKHFKPRKMQVLTEGNTRLIQGGDVIEFYVRDFDTYLDYLSDPEQLREGLITHAVGEANNFVANFADF